MVELINLEGAVSNPWYLGYLRYNFLMTMAMRTIFTSKCVQMDPMQQLPKMLIFFHMQQV